MAERAPASTTWSRWSTATGSRPTCRTEELIPLEPLAAKFEAFGWSCRHVDGHAFAALDDAFAGLPARRGRPTAIVAHTVRGRGVPSLEARADRWFADFTADGSRGAAPASSTAAAADGARDRRDWWCDDGSDAAATHLRGDAPRRSPRQRERRGRHDRREPRPHPQPARRPRARASSTSASASRPWWARPRAWPCAAGRPVVHALATFLTLRAFEFIRTDVGHPGLPVKLVGYVPGFLSEANGPTHQALEDVALMRGIPGMQVFCPADDDELAAALPAILADRAPCYVRYNASPPAVAHREPFVLGRAEVLSAGRRASPSSPTASCSARRRRAARAPGGARGARAPREPAHARRRSTRSPSCSRRPRDRAARHPRGPLPDGRALLDRRPSSWCAHRLRPARAAHRPRGALVQARAPRRRARARGLHRRRRSPSGSSTPC